MIDLKVVCTICGKEESNTDTIKEAACIVKKYNLKAEHYLNLLNIMSGKCLDSDEHSFVFDESFLKQTQEFVTNHKKNEEEIEKIKKENEGFDKETEELVLKCRETNTKITNNKERINSLKKNMEDNSTELWESTGIDNIKIWY